MEEKTSVKYPFMQPQIIKGWKLFTQSFGRNLISIYSIWWSLVPQLPITTNYHSITNYYFNLLITAILDED